jgi:acetyl-CoA/propionyl-CoA carboxylase biotin carboxyl carrier protein
VTLDGRTRRWLHAVERGAAGGARWLGLDGAGWRVRAVAPHPRGDRGVAAGTGPLTSPMPGTVIAVDVVAGDVVEPGQPVAVVEAMKMEHAVRATVAGVVVDVLVSVGDRVALDAPLVVVKPEGDA